MTMNRHRWRASHDSEVHWESPFGIEETIDACSENPSNETIVFIQPREMTLLYPTSLLTLSFLLALGVAENEYDKVEVVELCGIECEKGSVCREGNASFPFNFVTSTDLNGFYCQCQEGT